MRKRFWIVGFCLFVLLAAAALSIMVGSFAISPSDVLRTLLGGGSSWRYILVSAPLILFLAGLVWTHSRTLDILSLGDEGATALGVSTRRTRILFLAAGAALAALATAVAGNIAFLGLLGPQIALRITGMRHRLLLPLAALISSILLVVADMLARNLFSPLEIPAGILVSMIGIPYFIYLMMKLDRR